MGLKAFGHLRLFRYEVRRRREGIIPDLAEAVESPQHLSDDPRDAQRLLELVPRVPTPVWGRDELGTDEMWNSNSTISWLLARTGVDVDSIQLPSGGRAPAGGPASWWRDGVSSSEKEMRDAAVLSQGSRERIGLSFLNPQNAQ